MGAKGIRKRTPSRRLPSLRRRTNYIDEPPVMWPPPSSGFEADPFSPAGQMQGWWQFTGGGTDANEAQARNRQRPIGRAGAFILKLLGYRSPQPRSEPSSQSKH